MSTGFLPREDAPPPRELGGLAATARLAAASEVTETPLLSARWLEAKLGGSIRLKAENLQRTGSFKVRGAIAKLNRLERARAGVGVVAASAGNHGQAVAYAARAKGLPCRVFMPEAASVAKVEAVEAYGGSPDLGGASVEDCVERAQAFAAEQRSEFIHPFDDPDILIGQATLGLELLEQERELAKLVIPLGGGGLAGAVACTLKEAGINVHVIGVQVEGCDPYVTGEDPAPARQIHLADGIAVKRPGRLTRPLVESYVDEVCAVTEDSIAEAMVLLMQRSKLVVEGAGAAGVAALLNGQVTPASQGRTVAVISGGNVAIGTLAGIARRHESEAGRRLHLFTRVPDQPGGLAQLLEVVASARANVVAAGHLRDAANLHVGETGVELVLETRGKPHSEEVRRAIRAGGYPIDGPD